MLLNIVATMPACILTVPSLSFGPLMDSEHNIVFSCIETNGRNCLRCRFNVDRIEFFRMSIEDLICRTLLGNGFRKWIGNKKISLVQNLISLADLFCPLRKERLYLISYKHYYAIVSRIYLNYRQCFIYNLPSN